MQFLNVSASRRGRSVRVICHALLMLGVLALVGNSPAYAQPGGAKGKGAKGKTAGGHGGAGGHGAPPMGTQLPGSRQPGMGPGFGPQQPLRPEDLPGAGRIADGWQPPDPDKLPEGFEPPPEVPEIMKLEKPIATQKEMDDLKRDLGNYRKLLSAGEINSDKDRATLRGGIRYRLALLADPRNVEKLHNLREDLTVRDMQFAAKTKTRPDDVRAFRNVVCEEITKQVVPLFDNNFYVRVQAAILLGELDLVPSDPKAGMNLTTYLPAAKPLMEVIKDEKQPIAVKTAAVNSLHRILRLGAQDSQVRVDAAQAVIDELAHKDNHFWYQMRLVSSLAANEAQYDRATRSPFVINTLRSIVADPSRHYLVRSEAARVLGRVQYESSVPPADIVKPIAALALEMAKAMPKDPTNSLWRTCFVKIYFAFQAVDDLDKDAQNRRPGGLLNNPAVATAAKEAYSQVLPLVRSVLKNEKFAPDAVKSLEAYVGNTPENSGAKTPTAAAAPATTPARN